MYDVRGIPSNLTITNPKLIVNNKICCTALTHVNELNSVLEKRKGFDLSGYKLTEDKKKILRNCVEPETGLHIFNMAYKSKQVTLC
jgi:hypothetical protein